MSTLRLLALFAALGSTSCLRDTAFHCSTSAECGPGGTCQPGVGFCSVADGMCASGARFGSSAGSYANQCVGGDDIVDAPLADASTGDGATPDAPVTGCPSGFDTITGGQSTHKYRLINATANWAQQRAQCLTYSASAYLAIPDDLTELQAIATLSASTESWVGITDSAMENTFLTVKGVAATFLPWDTGQPDDANPGEDCVIIETPTSKLRDERCTAKFRAVCECEL